MYANTTTFATTAADIAALVMFLSAVRAIPYQRDERGGLSRTCPTRLPRRI